MKNKEIIFYVEESMDGGYEAKSAGHSIFTEADTMEDLKKNIKEAVKCHFDEDEIPDVVSLRFIREELMAL